MNEVHWIVGATVGAEERRAHARIGPTGTPKHFLWDYLELAATLDRQSIKGGL